MILATLLSSPAYAVLDHWRGGARLFRGKKNAEAAELYAMTGGKEGYRTWYWDMGVLPYVVFGIYTFALVFAVIGVSWLSTFVAAYLSGTYYFFRSQSPRKVFPAGNGVNEEEIASGLRHGAILGVVGLLPAGVIGAFFNPWLALLPLLGAPLGLYHRLFHGSPLFRSYGELYQGGLIIAPVVMITLWALR